MSDQKKPREFWISRHPDSVDPDKLTLIALREFYPDKNPLHVIEKSAYDELKAEVERLKEKLNQALSEEGYDPYCATCGSCGEDGCCHVEMCRYPDQKTETVQFLRKCVEDAEKERDALRTELLAARKAFHLLLASDRLMNAMNKDQARGVMDCFNSIDKLLGGEDG